VIMSRILDIALAGCAALILAPVLLFVAILVRLSVGRPVLFRQQRAGRDCRTFDIVKFRTMRDLRDGRGDLLPDRARVTAVGRFLRRTRLDELPELLNILRGEMSFVGPRPLLPCTIVAFGQEGLVRCSVRPGLTGWAQVNGNTLLSQEEKLQLDLWYVRHRSVWTDLRVIGKTVAVIIVGERRNINNLEKALASDRRRSC